MSEGNNTPGNPQDPWTQNPMAERTPPEAAASGQSSRTDEPWERKALTDLAGAALAEQRRARRWGIFFKFLTFAYLAIVLLMFMPSPDSGFEVGKKHTALIEIRGEIADDAEANADDIVGALRDAFENTHTAGVILRINSPGGSPVQAGYISDEIKRLKQEYPKTPIYAVISDMCASGGYYIAAATDEIYANKASIVGSIGVIMSGFGFVGTMDKLGVERRMLTAGEHKGFLDPFSPENPSDVEHVKTMLTNIHKQFIDTVKEGRGDRLKENPDLFTGLVWTGEQSVEMGLVDGLGSASYVAREIIGAEDIVDFTHRPDPFESFANRLGVVMAETFARIGGVESKNTLELR